MAGKPDVYAWLFGILGEVIAFVTGFFGRKIALTSLVIGGFLVALAALWLLIKGLTVGIISYIPDNGLAHWALVGASIIFPSNWNVCISAMLSADAAVFLYRWNSAHVLGAAAGT